MAKLILEDVSNLLGNPTSAANTINENNSRIEAALELTLTRSGLTPNQMQADLDMNSNDILNAGLIAADDIAIDGSDVVGILQRAEDAVEDAEASALESIAARDVAVQAAEEAAQYAAGLNLPPILPGDAGKSLIVNEDEDGYELKQPNVTVSSRTELKGLLVTEGLGVYLTENGREGMFVWKTGDYSSQISIDTAETFFIKADAVASTVGSWVRVVSGGVVTPEMAGAVGDGSADDSSAFNVALAALTAFGGGTLRAMKSYRLTNILVPSNVTIDAHGANIRSAVAGATNVIWKMAGSASGVRRAITNTAKGSILVQTTVLAHAGDFAVGDYALVQNEVFASPGNFGKNQEIARVAAANPATGEISFEDTLIGTYSGSTPTIEKITPVVNSRILGGSSVLLDSSAAEGGHIELDLAVRCQVQGVTIEGVNNLPGIFTKRSQDIDIVGNRIRKGQRRTNGGYAYGISVQESSVGVRVHRNHISGMREIMCTDRARFVIFSENTILGAYINGINAHSSTNENISIINNHIHGVIAGVAIAFGQGSGSNSDSVGVVSGNIISNTFGDGIQIVATGSTTTATVIVANNIINGFGQNLSNSSGIYINRVDGIHVVGNQINANGALGTGSYSLFVANCVWGVIKDNILVGGAFGIGVSVCGNLTIQSNRLRNHATQCVRVASADSTAVWILDNFSNVSNQSINATGTYQHRNSWQTLP